MDYIKMTILDKIAMAKFIKNKYFIKRSLYDEVVDARDWGVMETDRLNDYIKCLKRDVLNLIDEKKRLSVELQRSEYFKWLYTLTGFCGGVLIWALIIKFIIMA